MMNPEDRRKGYEEYRQAFEKYYAATRHKPAGGADAAANSSDPKDREQFDIDTPDVPVPSPDPVLREIHNFWKQIRWTIAFGGFFVGGVLLERGLQRLELPLQKEVIFGLQFERDALQERVKVLTIERDQAEDRAHRFESRLPDSPVQAKDSGQQILDRQLLIEN